MELQGPRFLMTRTFFMVRVDFDASTWKNCARCLFAASTPYNVTQHACIIFIVTGITYIQLMQSQHNPSPHPDVAGHNETSYNYKFIDDFEWVQKGKKNSETSETSEMSETTEVENDGSICTKIKEMLMSKKQKPSNHVLNFMVCLKFALCIFMS